jgi:hypothetical protein
LSIEDPGFNAQISMFNFLNFQYPMLDVQFSGDDATPIAWLLSVEH